MSAPAEAAEAAEAAENSLSENERALREQFVRIHLLTGAERDALREQIIETNMPLARSLASRYRGKGEADDDLSQVALEALIHAVDRFDPAFGVPFAGFAVPTIRGELRRHFRDHGWDVRVPRRLQENRQAVAQAVETLAHTTGVGPSKQAIAEHVGIAQHEVDEALCAGAAYQAEPLDLLGAEGADRREADVLGTDDAGLSSVDMHESLTPLLAELDEREQEILSQRFYGNKKQAEIAAGLGMSQMHVSRILTATLEWMRERIDCVTTDGPPGMTSKRRPPVQSVNTPATDLIGQRAVTAREVLAGQTSSPTSQSNRAMSRDEQ